MKEMQRIQIVCVIFVMIGCGSHAMRTCRPSITTASGAKAPKGPFCKGQLLLDERFTEFDRDLWRHEITLGGGGVSCSIPDFLLISHSVYRRR